MVAPAILGGLRSPHPSRMSRVPAVRSKGHNSIDAVLGFDPGQLHHFESHVAWSIALVLVYWWRAVDLIEEAPPFEWIDDETGEIHKLYLDLVCTLPDGRRLGFIVKSAFAIERGDWRRKARCIAAALPPSLADGVSLVSEQDVNPIEKHNALLFRTVRRPDPEFDSRAAALVSDTSAR